MRIRFIYKYLRNRLKKLIGNDDIATTRSFFNYVYTKRRDLDEAFPEMEVVAIGSSLSDYAFYSPSWSQSFNFGLTSSDLSVALELYENVLRGAPNLKIVLLYSGVFVPGFNLAYTSERHRLILYKHFFGIDYNPMNRIQQKSEKRILRKINKFSFESKDSERGYIHEKPHFPGIDVGARAKTHLKENQREPDQMDYFRRLRDLVESDGRDLYLIIPPVRSDYRDVLKEISNGDLFEKFKLMMPPDRILDFYDHKEFTHSDFGDCDHMNELGSKKITAMIRSRIVV
tara:strand:+ start:1479 stop:2336 length:858 start_codon:yes stop_codon:yes gene_type:complete